LALLEAGARVTAIEIDPVLAAALPQTVAERAPGWAPRLQVLQADALRVEHLDGPPAQFLVANLPYNTAVPVLLTFLERFETLREALVMVQAEVAARLAAGPGSKVYGIPSVKAAWWASARVVGTVPRNAFWPVPRVDSALVALRRRPPPDTTASREQVFAAVDAAFSARRKTLRAALAGWAGSAPHAEVVIRAAGIDPGARGESLSVEQFARLAAALESVGKPGQ
jgi:16S rRNA (adenine1518-N6/adenine1519-N6)-dimethyltransferase